MTADRPDNRPTDRPAEAVPLADAAARLGITPEAARKRLARHTLPGEKRADGWYVFLPPADEADAAAAEQPDTDQTELIEALRDEIGWLRAELDRRTEEIERRDVLLREALERIPAYPIALPSGQQPDTGTPPTDAEMSTTPGAASAPAPATPTPQRGSGSRSWWRRLLGLEESRTP